MNWISVILKTFHRGRCRILLNPDIEDVEAESFDSYRKCKKEVVFWEADGTLSEDVEGHAYIYAPIHFQDHCYGYCVFRDIDAFLYGSGLHTFTKSIGFSIENVVQKRKYWHVNRQLEHLFETDNLTGVYNRHGLERYAGEFFYSRMKQGKQVEVIFVDIDYLKKINDSLGHESGDIAIRMVGHALRRYASDTCLVFRYGGDEFLIFKESGNPDYDEFFRGVRQHLDVRQKEMELPFRVSASVGRIVAEPGENRTMEYYIRQADMQMYEIKQNRHRQDLLAR